MGDLSTHFDAREFRCKCGKCNYLEADELLIDRLERVIDYLSRCERGFKYLIITSGCRCPSHSVAVGGSANDAHTLCIAADWYVIDERGERYPSEQLAAVAELIGFGGIGIIDNTTIHTDNRDCRSYANNFWHGDERTGANVTTWAAHIPPAKIKDKHKIKLSYDGKIIFESEV